MTTRIEEKPVLVVTGLAAEARIATGRDTICVAAPPAALAERLETAAASCRPAAILSLGLCGGLAPHLRAGMLVLADSIVYRDKTWSCDRNFVSRLRAGAARAGMAFAEGAIACADAPVLTTIEKAELRAETGAVAVDTESHVAAAFAARHGLPFAVVRAVCDAANRNLPPLAIRAIDLEGRLDWPAIGNEIAARPAQFTALPGAALGTARAMRTLRRVRRLLGPGFGL